jgi:hypothetical protein
MAQAQQAKTFLLEGQQPGDPKHGMMGVYELVEGKEVSGRGVWKIGGKDYFMYYASNNNWFVGSRENMEAGGAIGWMSVASTALTPDTITEMWQVCDGGWIDAGKITTRI